MGGRCDTALRGNLVFDRILYCKTKLFHFRTVIANILGVPIFRIFYGSMKHYIQGIWTFMVRIDIIVCQL